MADNKGRRDTFDVSGDTNTNATSNKRSIEDKIEADLDKIMKKGSFTPADALELYNKYGDENEYLVDKILKMNSKKNLKIRKQARLLAEKIYQRYNNGTKPLHEILEKMLKYKKENKWSDKEYDEFRKELTNLLTGNRALEIDYNQNLTSYKSRINRALGGIKNEEVIRQADSGLRIKDSEKGVLQDILNMYDRTANLHRTVFMHSLMYEDCSLVAITGEFDRKRHLATNYIDPILACMFIPKIDIFEIHMLYANFGSIIKARSERKQITNEPDLLLYYDITSDPNDVVCEINSPIADLRNRYRVQIALWGIVMKLRNGNYYDSEAMDDFSKTLDACRNNLYDNADLAYNNDEGAIIRRLLSVFSLRPTIIVTKPVYSIASFAMGQLMPQLIMGANGVPSPFGQSMNPFNNQPIYTITSIPMITLQIPPVTDNAEPIDLRSATTQTLWVNENKTIIPKEQSIIYSKEVLIFYINRRIQRIQLKTFSNPLSFSQLPLTMSSFERLNGYPVHVPDRLVLDRGDEVYNLRSVVSVTETKIGGLSTSLVEGLPSNSILGQNSQSTGIITGRTGLITKPRNFETGVFEPEYYLYDPFGASLPVRHPDQSGYFTNKPISHIPPLYSPSVELTGGIENPSFFDRASRTGTIFIYAKPQGYNPNQPLSLF